jgi:ABC-type lipoprotein release transport system permease subunit
MRALIAVAGTGLNAVLLSPLRSFVTAACLIAVLLPYLVGLGLSRGVQREAADAVKYGADLYVSGSQFGRDVPLPLSAVDEVRKVDGVLEVVPRIVGSVTLGAEGEGAVVVGLPADHFPAGVTCIEGRLPAAGNRNELVLGTDLARQLNVRIGDRLPPFYRNRKGEKLSEVVGLFR